MLVELKKRSLDWTDINFQSVWVLLLLLLVWFGSLKKKKPGLMIPTYNKGKKRQKNCEFEDSLGYIGRPCHKKRKTMIKYFFCIPFFTITVFKSHFILLFCDAAPITQIDQDL